MLTHIDLFAGIGGFSLGFENAGIDTLAHVEIDDKCKGVLRNHWGDHLIFSDVCEVGKHNLPYADIITFGSPCQDLSIAGKRKGFADGTRSNLFFEAVRIIREIEPRYAVWENVPGALSSHNGRDFQSVIESLLDTDIPMPKSGRWASSGMVRTGQKEVAWRILDAQYFGVAQRRRRLFLIFCSGNGSPSSILFEREGVRWNPPARGKTGEEIARETCSSIERHCYKGISSDNLDHMIGFDLAQITSKLNYSNPKPGDPQPPINTFAQGMVAYENHPADSRITETGDISQQLTSRMGTGGGNVPLVANTLAGGSSKAHSDMTSGQQDGNVIVAFQRSQLRLNDKLDNLDVSPTLKAQTKNGDTELNICNWQSGGGKMDDDKAASLRSGAETNYQFAHIDQGVRRLTPTECERLQGFPDGWTAGQADSTRYKQLGNAVAVPVAEWIGKRITHV